ncbi:MAG: hypothetical protein HC887_12640 [Desulfobacteraceae bacterium]|nr:hypothetical protein [Desulfobacteraceae bacterium]
MMKHKTFRYICLFVMLFMALSGFGQMPIFKRYYVADIPGLGWLADFYVTHFIHYVGAIVLIGILCYSGVEYLLIHRKTEKISLRGYIRIGLSAAISISGILLVIRNLSGYWFPNNIIIFLDLLHLAAVMLLIIYMLSAAFLFRKIIPYRQP